MVIYKKRKVELMITLYSQPGCPQCHMVHTLLDKKNIKYEECQDTNKMRAIGIQHTPTIDTGTELLTGKAMMNFINTYGRS